MGKYSAASGGSGSLTGVDDQSSSNDDQITIKDTEVVINDDSDPSMAFRVESNSNENMLYVGANNKVGIGTNTPGATMHIVTSGNDQTLSYGQGTLTGVNGIMIESTAEHQNNAAPIIAFYRNATNQQDPGDGLANILFVGEDDAGNAQTYGQWKCWAIETNNGSEAAAMSIQGMVQGTNKGFINMLGAADDSGEANDYGGKHGPEIVLNQNSADIDFRVESNDNDAMLFVDGGNNRVGIGTSEPEVTLDVKTTGTVIGRVASTDGHANLRFGRANSGYDAAMLFYDDMDQATPTLQWRIQMTNGGTNLSIRDEDGSPDGNEIMTFKDGTATPGSGGIDINTDVAIAPGHTLACTRLPNVAVSTNPLNLSEGTHAGRYVIYSGSSGTVNLPSSSDAGEHYTILNTTGGDITIGRNGNNINGAASNITVGTYNAVTCIAIGSNNWIALGV